MQIRRRLSTRTYVYWCMLPRACTDQSLTEMCKFKGIKDSQGECHKRGEGPPTPALARKKHRRAYPIDYDELVTREVDDYDWN
jgi:hypothetical protein